MMGSLKIIKSMDLALKFIQMEKNMLVNLKEVKKMGKVLYLGMMGMNIPENFSMIKGMVPVLL